MEENQNNEVVQEDNTNQKTGLSEKFGNKNIAMFAFGIILLVAGYFVLTFTDSRGQNWASILSPIMLVGAYIIIGLSMIIK